MASACDTFSQKETGETWQWWRRYAARAQGLKRHKMLSKSNVGARLRGGGCCWCSQESCHFYAVSLIHSLYQFIIEGKEAWPARLVRPRAEKRFFSSPFPRETRGKNELIGRICLSFDEMLHICFSSS